MFEAVNSYILSLLYSPPEDDENNPVQFIRCSNGTILTFSYMYPTYVGQAIFMNSGLETLGDETVQKLLDFLRLQYPLVKVLRYHLPNSSNLAIFKTADNSTSSRHTRFSSNMTEKVVWFQLNVIRKLNHCVGNAELKRFELNIDFHLRIATFSDLPEIWTMINELAEAENDSNLNSFDDFEQNFKANKFQVILAEVDGQIAGYIVTLGNT